MEPLRKKLGAAVAGGVLLLSGAAGAYALTGTAGAQDTTSTTTATQDTSTSATASSDQAAPPANGQAPQGQPPQGGGGQHQANGITETILTGTDLEKVTAAAEAAVPGGTIDRAETDAEGAAFEAHVTKSDGSKVTVKLDSSYKVTSVEDGMR